MPEFEDAGVTIRLKGFDKETYKELIKAILHMLGNQRTEDPLTPGEVGQVTHMISDMLPE